MSTKHSFANAQSMSTKPPERTTVYLRLNPTNNIMHDAAIYSALIITFENLTSNCPIAIAVINISDDNEIAIVNNHAGAAKRLIISKTALAKNKITPILTAKRSTTLITVRALCSTISPKYENISLYLLCKSIPIKVVRNTPN